MHCIEQHLSGLKTLKLTPFYWQCPQQHEKVALYASLADAFRMNSQLSELSIAFPKEPLSMELMRSASELLPSLNLLEVQMSPESPVAEGFVHFKSVRIFKYSRLGKRAIPFTFDQLKQFDCQSVGDEDAYNFVKEHPSILKLSACNGFFDKWDNSVVLPSLREIKINNHVSISAKRAISMLNKFPAIEKFHFLLKCPTTDQLNALFPQKWQIKENGFFLRKKFIIMEKRN